MNIPQINFNYIPQKPQSRGNTTLRANNQLQSDVVSFTGFNESSYEKMEKLVPKNKGMIYKKVRDENGDLIEKIPVEADIVKTQPDEFSFMLDGKPVGSVTLRYVSKDECKRKRGALYKDYENEGISGDRIIVEYVENKNDYKYGGIGHLADLIEVAACKELGFEPNVVSKSFEYAAPLHYLRGKRFVPFKNYIDDYYYYYNNKEPDDIVKGVIDKTKPGEDFDTFMICHEFLMYMPKEMIKKLEKELDEHPIF